MKQHTGILAVIAILLVCWTMWSAVLFFGNVLQRETSAAHLALGSGIVSFLIAVYLVASLRGTDADPTQNSDQQMLSEVRNTSVRTLTTADDYFDAANLSELDGNWAEANEHYSKAIELQAEFPEAYFNRAGNWVELGEYEFAISDYQQVLASSSDDATTHEYLAQAYLDEENPLRDVRLALVHAQRSYEVSNPLRFGAASTLATALAANEEIEDAIAMQNKAIELARGELEADIWIYELQDRLTKYQNLRGTTE